jgi:hypothetical protein
MNLEAVLSTRAWTVRYLAPDNPQPRCKSYCSLHASVMSVMAQSLLLRGNLNLASRERPCRREEILGLSWDRFDCCCVNRLYPFIYIRGV